MAEAATAPAAAAEKPAATLPNFEELAHGRVPLATGPSVADTWSDVSDGVPRPDRTLGGLRWHAWLGFLGLDHFYLRNPTTGILKLITFGGFLMWWLWDLMQVYTEGSRVIKYGISTPFDIATGIGQGMIVNDIGKDGIPIKTAYTSKSSFTLWQLGSLFSFVGLDSFITKDWARGSRKLMEFIMFIAAGKMVVDNYNGVSGHGIFSVSNLMSTMVVFFFGSIVITNWTLALSNLFSPPETLLSKGIQVKPEVNSMLNSYSSLLDKLTFIDSKTRDRVKADLNYGSVSPEVMEKKFKIGHKDDLQREEEAEAASAAATGSNWLQSVLIWMLLLLGLVVQIGVYLWKALLFAIKSAFKGPVAATMDEMQADAAEKLRSNVSLMAFMENKVKGQMGLPLGTSFIPGQVLGPPGTVIAQPQVSAPTTWNPFSRLVQQGQVLGQPQTVGIGIPISSIPSAPPAQWLHQPPPGSVGTGVPIARTPASQAKPATNADPTTVRNLANTENPTDDGPPSNSGDPRINQEGGARRGSSSSGLSTDAMALGAVVVALIGGGALKALIDNIISE